MRSILQAGLLPCVLAAVGCGDEPATPGPARECPREEPASCEPRGGATAQIRVETIRFAGQAPELGPRVVHGFDLDCRVTEGHDPQGCSIQDYVGPDGQPGIDNRLGSTVEAWGIDVDPARAVPPSIRIAGLDDPVQDDCVAVEMVDEETGTVVATSTRAWVERGWLVAALTPVRLSLPLVTFSSSVPTPAELVLEGAWLEVDLEDSEREGMLGGGVDTDVLVAAMEEAFGDDFTADARRSIADSLADLSPDDAGRCTAASVAFALRVDPLD